MSDKMDLARLPEDLEKKLKEGNIQTPEEAAKHLVALFPQLLEYESGSFLDVRTMD